MTSVHLDQVMAGRPPKPPIFATVPARRHSEKSSMRSTVHEARCVQAPSRDGGGSDMLPMFEVEPGWAKVPDQFSVGDVSGVAADEHDHVWIIHRYEMSDAGSRPPARPDISGQAD